MKAKSPEPAAPAWFKRPALSRSEPMRHIGTLYRSAEGPPGSAIGGVPLSSAEDAVVAAVRMGYRVAQLHIDRTGRLAERLNRAAERAVGPEPQRQAVDATEQLIGKAMLAGLEWLEGAAAESGSPLRRYANAQYKLLGTLLGLQAEATPGAAATTHAPPAEAPRPSAPSAVYRAVRVKHRGKERRAVKAPRVQLDCDVEGGFPSIRFYAVTQPDLHLVGELQIAAAQPALLYIDTGSASPAGLWRAAVCADDGEQLGWVEFEL